MAKPRKVGKRWRMEVQVRGEKHSRYFDNRQDAINWSIELEVVGNGKSYISGRSMQMLFDRYADEVSSQKKGERWERVRLAKIGRALGHLQCLEFARVDVERYRDALAQSVSPSSVNRELNVLSSVCTRAVEWRWMRENPCLGVRRPKENEARDRILTDAEVRALVEATGTDFDTLPSPRTKTESMGPLIVLLDQSAMRLSEVTTLDWQHVHLRERYLHLPQTKNGSKRDVPLSSRAVQALESMRPKESGPVFAISAAVASTYFRKIRRKIGIECHLHDLRHTCVTRWASDPNINMHPLQLARAAGFSTNMALRYFNEHASSIANRLG